MPAHSLYVLDLTRVAKNLHTIVVKWVRLGQVYDIESYFQTFGRISNSVKEPLSMAICIDVILQNKVILFIRFLDDG